MRIRQMYPTEAKRLAELLYLSVHTLCVEDYSPEELRAWVPKKMDMKKFNASLFMSRNLVMVHDRTIVGFVCIERDGYVNRLYVHPDFVRRGIGSALLKTAEEWAKKRGVSRVRLAASKTALNFYKKQGYVPVDVEVVKKSDVVFNNTIMEKRL